MVISSIDWYIIIGFLLFIVGIGFWSSKKSGESSKEFFLAGRSMPWWLLGVSMVATTFAADTPNLVTDMVRSNGVAKNWAWWAFLTTGMVTVFIFSKLWRRSNVNTDLEFYELRYSGKLSSFLRGFRALYLGIFFNCLIMANVSLAAIKIGGIMLGLTPFETLLYTSIVVVISASLGGIRGVIWGDFFQFIVAMIGAVAAAYYALSHPAVNGLDGLLSHEIIQSKISVLPDLSDPWSYVPLLIIPIVVQWWTVWYPGSEPGGGGYIAQRMLAAKSENHALGATFFFNFAHYALRPWPWIIVALASIIIYPEIADIQSAFPNMDSRYIKNDIAYPAMLTILKPGWLGLVVASLAAAFLSTISTHLNWGASYVVNDFFKRFVDPTASEKKLVNIGRITTILLTIFSVLLALYALENAQQAFDILLLTGAGTGLIYILRWFWWRVNALSEIVGMILATILGFILVLGIDGNTIASLVVDTRGVSSDTMASLLQNQEVGPFSDLNELKEVSRKASAAIFPLKLIISTIIVSIGWLLAAYFGPSEKKEVLENFYRQIQPGGPGWTRIVEDARSEGREIVLEDHKKWPVPNQILMIFIGSMMVYAVLFGLGQMIFGSIAWSLGLLGFAGVLGFLIYRTLTKS